MLLLVTATVSRSTRLPTLAVLEAPVAAPRRDAWRLLLALIDSRTTADRIIGLTDAADYPALLAVAQAHRVLGVVHRRLVDAGVDLPRPWAARFQRYRSSAALAQLASYRTIAGIVDAVSLPLLVVKGPVLGAVWYGDPSVRRFSDVDVLVRRRDFPVVLDQLLAAGFAERSQNWRGFLDHEVAEIPLAHEAATVDLHWDLVAIGSIRREFVWDMESLFARAESVRLGPEHVLTLDPADTLLHLCVNGGLDGARMLSRLVDIDVVARGGRVDWAEFVDRARGAGTGALCGAVLQRTWSLIGTPLPPGLLADLEPFPGWLWLNAFVDRHRHSRRFVYGVASGALLASGRATRRQTFERFMWTALAFGKTRLGRPGLTDAGGQLDWQRGTDTAEGDADRLQYLNWVGGGSGV
jgi:hypothetical protein